MTTGAEYARVHYAARKLLDTECARCGALEPLEAAFRPDTPEHRKKIDRATGCAYSLDLRDYVTLCIPCHRRLDLVDGRPYCLSGHRYTPDNTSIKTDGSRRCLTCHRDQESRRMQGPEYRERKHQRDRGRVLTAAQKARKIYLQRQRRKTRRTA